MIKNIFLFAILFASCNQNVKQENIKKKTLETISKTLKSNKEKEFYFEFIQNLEKKLWSLDFFVKTDYRNRGWQLIDKNGKYIIRSEDNFTKYHDTSFNYSLTIIIIDNYLTNKNGVNRTIRVPVKMTEERKQIVSLDFIYDKQIKSEDMSFSEKTLNFPFTSGIIVDYRDCFNNDKGFSWRQNSIVQFDFDCKVENQYLEKKLW